MKKVFLLIFVLVISIFSTQTLYGQLENTKKVKFGIGISLFTHADYIGHYNYKDMNNVFMTVDIVGKIRIEPSFALTKNKNISQYTLGIGVFGVKRYSKLNMLYGLRVATGRRKTKYMESEDLLYYSNYSHYYYDIVAPTIAAEYFLINKFSLGAELQLRGLFINEESLASTYSSVMIRFYF